MQIPEFWAEARLEGEVGEKRRVVRRFGWSDDSAAAAESHAQHRAAVAFAELQAGREVPARERKLAYGGQGLPIREQVVARNGDDVITRNSYGARCLNEPDVLFADIDFAPSLPPAAARALRILGCNVPFVALLLAIALFARGQPTLAVMALLALLLLPPLALVVMVWLRQRPTVVAAARGRMRQRIDDVVAQRPGARFALYETPAGLRLLALHRTFDPASEAVQELFRELGTDPAYAQMCALQACFRARVSPKPWRIGLPRSPGTAVWPIPAARMAEREAWIATYETKSAGFAACRFVEELGDGQVDARCRVVQQMHDQLCQAHTELPIA